MARRDPWLVLGVLAFFGLVFLALFGERIAPHEPIYFVPEHGTDPRPYDPGVVFPFGSDILGRDLFSVVLAGARATLVIVVLSGVARVIAGALIAALGSWWRPTRIATESVAELVSAVPATLVALILVKVFLRTDPSLLAITAALLVTGWAGPYRVIRAEVDRLGAMSFSQGAVAIGVGRWRLFWRHHLPHLAPTLAINLSQQIVASLVLVAELGVLSVFVGASRLINIEESLTRAAIREVPFATIADPPEWGGLLANARTIESLWTTRWLFLIPGIAFAITAVAVALIGFALARRYARRDLTQDVRGRGAAALLVALLALFVASTLVPERYAEAREWASAARAEVRPAGEIESAFSEAGLRPIGASYAVRRDQASIVQTAPATATVGTATVTEEWPRKSSDPGKMQVRSFVFAGSGGGNIEAPLVFAGRGLSPADYPPPPPSIGYLWKIPELGEALKDYADDYAGIDVRGKAVLVVRFLGVCPFRGLSNCGGQTLGYTFGPSAEDYVANAVKRGAAAVLFVDPSLPLYTDTSDNFTYSLGNGYRGGLNPYKTIEARSRPLSVSGVPVVVLGIDAARRLTAPLGLDITPLIGLDQARSEITRRSMSRDLGVTARVNVPLATTTASSTSYIGEVTGVPNDAGRILVWVPRRADARRSTVDVLAALARSLGDRRVPFILVDFDPSVDPIANTKRIGDELKDRRIALLVVLDRLDGGALRLTTSHGDLIPALDHYADRAGARHEVTRMTTPPSAMSDSVPFIDVKTVVFTGAGGDGDPRADAAALVGYLAGRLALGAEELPR
jgi:peptide/nickel transport system permease protein